MTTLPDDLPDLQYVYQYESPTPGSITIAATGLERGDDEVFADSVFEDVVACNFNLVSLYGKDEPNFKKTLANIKGIIGVMATSYYLLLSPSKNQEEALQKAKHFYDVFKNFVPVDERGNSLGFEPITAWTPKDEPVYKQFADKTSGYIVNYPGAPLQKLTLGFSSLYKIERIAVSTTGTITRSLLSSYNLDLNLAAGEMEVFRWWGN